MAGPLTRAKSVPGVGAVLELKDGVCDGTEVEQEVGGGGQPVDDKLSCLS